MKILLIEDDEKTGSYIVKSLKWLWRSSRCGLSAWGKHHEPVRNRHRHRRDDRRGYPIYSR